MRLGPSALALAFSLGVAASAGAQPFVSFNDFCDTSSFSLNGMSGSLNPNAQCVLRLTDGLSQGSSAFLTSPFSLASNASFSTYFRFQMTNPQGIGDSDGVGADGIVFAVQTAGNSVGGGGGGIGYLGISPSLGVEFDTFNNGGGDQNNGNHIGIDLNGDLSSVVLTPVAARFNDGNVWYAWVDYNGATQLLEARVSQAPTRPAAPTVQYTVDLPTLLGTTDAYVGFTSGTGGGANNHEILSWQMVGSYIPYQEAAVPTLSLPMLAFLGLALAAAGYVLSRR